MRFAFWGPPCSSDRLASEKLRQSLATTMTRWLKVDVPVFVTSRWNPIFPPKVTCWTSLEVVPISGLRTTLAPVSVDRPPADPTAMQNVTKATPAAKSARFPLISLPPSSRLPGPTAGPRAAGIFFSRPGVNRGPSTRSRCGRSGRSATTAAPNIRSRLIPLRFLPVIPTRLCCRLAFKCPMFRAGVNRQRPPQ